MRSRVVTGLTVLTLVAVLASLGQPAARGEHHQRYPYVLVDVGTFGGPNSETVTGTIMLNNRGMLVGVADTAIPAPASLSTLNQNMQFAFADSSVQHAFLERRGVLTDLGALPGANSSEAYWVTARGDALGLSTYGVMDPLVGYPATAGILWKDGRTINLGMLGGYENSPYTMNNQDQVTGIASNAIPDPYSLAGWATQTRGYLWQDGAIHDLGTLGGPDTFASYINERGQIAGTSYINSTPNPPLPGARSGVPTLDPFVWQDGHMRDLGTLGGTSSAVTDLTNTGMVIGRSNLAGDASFHPFLWNGRSLKDLGTLGGDYGSPSWANDFGQVVGWAQTPGNATSHAVLWRNGVTQDLGLPPGADYSYADAINLEGQIVGGSGAFNGTPGNGTLWQRGSGIDLNTLIAPSALHITEAVFINDRGEIAAESVQSVRIGNQTVVEQRAVLLMPTDEADAMGIVQTALTPFTGVSAVSPQSNAISCPTLASWLAQLKASSAPARPIRGTFPVCLGG